MSTSQYPISATQRETYAADGALFLPGVLDKCWLKRLTESVENLEAKELREGEPQGFFDRMRLWEHDEGLRDVIFDSPAADIAAQFLRAERLNLLYDQLFIKRPASNVRTAWHNDLPNWPVSGTQLITIWVSLDPIGAENGMLEFLAGSHRWDRVIPGAYGDLDGSIDEFHMSFPDRETQASLRARYATLEAEVAAGEHKVLGWETKPGDAIVFDASIIHGAVGQPTRGSETPCLFDAVRRTRCAL